MRFSAVHWCDADIIPINSLVPGSKYTQPECEHLPPPLPSSAHNNHVTLEVLVGYVIYRTELLQKLSDRCKRSLGRVLLAGSSRSDQPTPRGAIDRTAELL